MKKLTLVTLISGALSTGAFAGSSDKDKIESTFAELDSDGNGYVTMEEAKDEGVHEHFAKIDANSDDELSIEEFQSHLHEQPMHFEDDITTTAQSGSIGDIEDEYPAKRVNTSPTMERGDTRPIDGNWDSASDGDHLESGNGTESIARTEFDRIDTDNDGHLSKAEAARHDVDKAFEDIDQNNDQLITRVEYAKFRQNTSDEYDE